MSKEIWEKLYVNTKGLSKERMMPQPRWKKFYCASCGVDFDSSYKYRAALLDDEVVRFCGESCQQFYFSDFPGGIDVDLI